VGLTLWGRGLEKHTAARERAEATARHNAAELEAAFAAMPHGSHVYDAAGSMVRTNAAARRSMTSTRSGLTSMTLAKTPVFPPPRWASDCAARSCLRSARSTASRFLASDSFSPGQNRQEMIVSFSSAALQLGGQAIGAVTVWTDITDLIRTQQALRDADRRKDEFLAVLFP